MKAKIFLYFIVVVLIIAVLFSIIYLYIKSINGEQNNNENNIYLPGNNEESNLISNVDQFLFTDRNTKLIYEGGPSHWGSKTITLNNLTQTDNNKKAILHIVDESDLKGDLPKKEWNQIWEANSEGSLFIDNILMLKSPIVVGQKWSVSDYTPVINSDKKYTATITITGVTDSLNSSNQTVREVTTNLTIPDIKTVDNNIYKETRIFKSGIGIKELKVTEPTISNLFLNYWLQNNELLNK